MLTVETYPTVTETARAMGADARFLAGGTLVMRDANYATGGFSRILRTTDPALREVRTEADRIVIGAGITLAQVMAHRDLDHLAPVARVIGGPAVRNMGTVGGNLFAPHPYGDFAAALLALDGQALLADGSTVPLADLFAHRDTFNGIVTAVSIARPMRGEFRFRKVSRTKPKGVSVMSISAWLPQSGGRISGARVAYGAMGPAPLRAPAVERALEGATLDARGIEPAVAVAAEGLSPPEDSLASAWYRAEVAGVHLRRLLLNEEAR